MTPTAALKPLSASLPAGVVADRVSKKRILVIVLAANAVAAGTVSGLALAGAALYWLLGLSACSSGPRRRSSSRPTRRWSRCSSTRIS
ncbi:hypothetical protein ACEUE7_00060 [Micrococcus endophyticus]|uniref:hypothetical protein n=1 Tax=Micrococcus endophyticus TaxID=455343 RepID=UPI0035A831A1